jgi:hypothetical protein
MSGGYWGIFERISVADMRIFLDSVDYDVSETCVWLSNKFNTALHRSFTNPSDFDLKSVHLAILGFKNRHTSEFDLRNIIHFLVFHHYMLLFHKIEKSYELRIMQAKIAHHAGVSLEEYESSD